MSMKITDHWYAEANSYFGDIIPACARKHWSGDECWCDPEPFDLDVLIRREWADKLRLPEKMPFYLHTTDSDYYNTERESIRDSITEKVPKENAWFLKGLV